jgi:hypothetical protein
MRPLYNPEAGESKPVCDPQMPQSNLETVKTSVVGPLQELGSGATGLKTDVPDFNLYKTTNPS